jgi:hypothetical protein
VRLEEYIEVVDPGVVNEQSLMRGALGDETLFFS